MCALSAVLRAKPDWWTKFKDPEIRARWKTEAVGAPAPVGDFTLAEDEVDYVLDELTHYAALRDAETGIEVRVKKCTCDGRSSAAAHAQASIFHRIWQSDTLVPFTIRENLLRGVTALEDVPDADKDWHPGSDSQVLDLVHPSLCCISYSRTFARTVLPEALQTPMPPIDYTSYLAADPRFVRREDRRLHDDRLHAASKVNPAFISQKFSWLPTDFAISLNGSSAKALGYINNLHPEQHREMYPVLEQLIAHFVPLWERVLGESAAGYVLPARTKGFYKRERTRDDAYYEALQDDEYLEDFYATSGELRPPYLRGPFQGHASPPVIDLKGRTLQVIIKLANIYLVSILQWLPTTS
jgi:hypothetical protein